jgi:nucleotide-binding universal stress UspA family protein
MADSGIDRWTHPAVILAATDLSDLDRLMPFAFKIAGKTGARLILMHMLSASAGMTVDVAGMPIYDPAGAADFAARALDSWCKRAHQLDLQCEGLVREGHAAQQIVAAIRQFHADRVVLGTRSRSRLGKLLLGSVAEQVLRSVNIPVLTVGPEAHLQVEGSVSEPVVLHATTLKEASRPSAALACHLAASEGAKLVLLHVLPALDEMARKGLPAALDSAALHELHMLAVETGGGCCTVIEAKVAHGNPAIEVLAEAAARHASLIVLGAANHTTFENLTRDRTIYRVLAHARCPVLTLREPVAKPGRVEAEQLAVHQ